MHGRGGSHYRTRPDFPPRSRKLVNSANSRHFEELKAFGNNHLSKCVCQSQSIWCFVFSIEDWVSEETTMDVPPKLIGPH